MKITREGAMFVVLGVASLVLLTEVVLALRSGRTALVALCFGGLAFAYLILRDWYRTRAALSKRNAEGAGSTRDGTLVAVVYPDQLGRLDDLMIAVEPLPQEVIVLGVTASTDCVGARAGASVARSRLISPERDPRLVAALTNVVAGVGRPISLMSAEGADPILVALSAALDLCVSRLVAFCSEDARDEERHYLEAWKSLPDPRPEIQVRLIPPKGSAPSAFNLLPTGATTLAEKEKDASW